MTPTQRTLAFTVFGKAMQRGSKTPWIPRYKDGSPVLRQNGKIAIAMMDSNKKSAAWMSCVRTAAAEAMNGRDLMMGPLKLTVAFYFSRPKSHFRTGKNSHQLKDSAPHYHAQTPDMDKLLRCLKDSLKGIAWVDDRQVCRYGEMSREWTLSQERAEVLIEELLEGPTKDSQAISQLRV